MTKSMKFGKLLREIRLKRKKSRRDISYSLQQRGVGVTERTIASWEKGETLPDVLQVCDLAMLLKVPIGYFFEH